MEKIILASGSPRRKEILKNNNIDFQVIVSNVEENFNQKDTKEQIAMSLALLKALNVEKKCKDGIILSADTIVYKDSVFGKPKDEADAFSMLNRLRGTWHDVVTGVAVIRANTFEKLVFCEITKVYFKDFTEDDIKAYIHTGEVWGKAGSYAIQGKGSNLIEKIEGDYFNVMGLPFETIKSMMNKHFNMHW